MTALNLRRVAAVARAQVLEFRRDFGSMFLTLLFPLFFVVALVATNLGSTKFSVDFGLVSPGATSASQAFVAALASENVRLKRLDRDEALRQLRDGKLAGVVIVPAGDLGRGTARIELVTEERFEGFGKQAMQAARARLLLSDGTRGDDYAFKVSTFRQATNTQFAFIYPGMLALALVQLGMFSTAMPLLRARERGTFRFLLLTPLTAAELVTGQVAFRVAVAGCQLLLLLAAGSFVLHLSLAQWAAIAGVSVLGVTMLVAIGYALAGLPRSADSGSSMIMIVNFAMMFGGNIFWDPTTAPLLKAVAHLLPVSYLSDLYRQIVSGNEGLWPPVVDVAAIMAWSALALFVAGKLFRFDMRQETAPARWSRPALAPSHP